ncbi:MAG TPA: preprotein translocase subunit SecE [Longimicrobium sp.]|jgi:preprotein translocase subunit SecE|nr:preprotein translocase subunit SecE [Longimicrobium sp.]
MAEKTRTTALDFFREVSEQVRKVTWPDRAQLKESTGVIAVFVLTVALIIYGMDYAVRVTLELVTSLFTG